MPNDIPNVELPRWCKTQEISRIYFANFAALKVSPRGKLWKYVYYSLFFPNKLVMCSVLTLMWKLLLKREAASTAQRVKYLSTRIRFATQLFGSYVNLRVSDCCFFSWEVRACAFEFILENFLLRLFAFVFFLPFSIFLINFLTKMTTKKKKKGKKVSETRRTIIPN